MTTQQAARHNKNTNTVYIHIEPSSIITAFSQETYWSRHQD